MLQGHDPDFLGTDTIKGHTINNFFVSRRFAGMDRRSPLYTNDRYIELVAAPSNWVLSI